MKNGLKSWLLPIGPLWKKPGDLHKSSGNVISWNLCSSFEINNGKTRSKLIALRVFFAQTQSLPCQREVNLLLLCGSGVELVIAIGVQNGCYSSQVL